MGPRGGIQAAGLNFEPGKTSTGNGGKGVECGPIQMNLVGPARQPQRSISKLAMDDGFNLVDLLASVFDELAGPTSFGVQCLPHPIVEGSKLSLVAIRRLLQSVEAVHSGLSCAVIIGGPSLASRHPTTGP